VVGSNRPDLRMRSGLRGASLAQVDEFEPKAHTEVAGNGSGLETSRKAGRAERKFYVSTYGQTKVHSYLSPPDGLMVNTS
jgi:hypothetical protein